MKFIFKSFLLISYVMVLSIILMVKSDGEFTVKKNIFDGKLFKNIVKFLNRTDLLNNPKCKRDIDVLYKSLLSEKELWSFKMLDAWGKIPSGILSSHIDNFGDYDECIKIKHSKIKGKYCLAKFPIDFSPLDKLEKKPFEIIDGTDENVNRLINLRDDSTIFYASGICFPHSCKSTEITKLFEVFLKTNGLKQNVSIDESDCTTNNPIVWTTRDRIALILFIIIGTLIVLSTLYDILTRYYKIDFIRHRHELLRSFSIWLNTTRLISNKRNSESLRCINGLRTFSLLWVISGHRYGSSIISPNMNNIDILYYMQDKWSAVYFSAPLAVDTFFVLSGLLVSYTLFKYNKNDNHFNIPIFYLHRIFRTTPALAAVIFFQMTLFKYLGDGPLWNSFTESLVLPCEEKWWTTLLYIQNYVNPDSVCISQTWFLSCDLHLYIFSPILIYPFLRSKKFGWINIICWIFISQTVASFIVFRNEWSAATLPLRGFGTFLTKYYHATHTRATPWLMGFATGYFLHIKSKNKIKINMILASLLWIISFTIIIGLIVMKVSLQQFNHEFSHAEDSFYNAFAKNIWSVAIIWIIVACTHGYGGPINWFLCLDTWEILSRLSYSMYLVHLSVLALYTGRLRSPQYFSYFNVFNQFNSDVIFTLFAGYLLTISIELPCSNLEKLLYYKRNIDSVTTDDKPTIPNSNDAHVNVFSIKTID